MTEHILVNFSPNRETHLEQKLDENNYRLWYLARGKSKIDRQRQVDAHSEIFHSHWCYYHCFSMFNFLVGLQDRKRSSGVGNIRPNGRSASCSTSNQICFTTEENATCREINRRCKRESGGGSVWRGGRRGGRSSAVIFQKVFAKERSLNFTILFTLPTRGSLLYTPQHFFSYLGSLNFVHRSSFHTFNDVCNIWLANITCSFISLSYENYQTSQCDQPMWRIWQ